jgi:hypothetical protein
MGLEDNYFVVIDCLIKIKQRYFDQNSLKIKKN